MSNPIFDPVVGFTVVWLILGSAIAYIFGLLGFKSLKAIAIAYAFSLVPASLASLMLASN